VAGNFFTRTPGLHPTPSTCFPPRPPEQGGKITGSLKVIRQIDGPFAATVVKLELHNTFYFPGTTVNLVWTLPGLQGTPPNTCGDTMGVTFNTFRTMVPGTYTAKTKCTWPNGQTRTFQFIFITTPPP
jgi:hypothetical protein